MTEEYKQLFQELMLGKISDDAKLYLIKNGFFEAPCSTKFHLSRPNGLIIHSINVTITLLDLTEKLKLTWGKKESPYLIGMFHDLCKIDQYKYNPITKIYDWNSDQQELGHGDKSIKYIEKYICTLTEEERMCIRWHMGSFDEKSNWAAYTDAIEKYPNVLYTHMADMIATHILEKEN